jgi:hypothetical protein
VEVVGRYQPLDEGLVGDLRQLLGTQHRRQVEQGLSGCGDGQALDGSEGGPFEGSDVHSDSIAAGEPAGNRDVDDDRSVSHQPMLRHGRHVADRSIVADGEQRAPVASAGVAAVPEGVDTVMEADQPAAPKPRLDAVVRDAGGEELPAADPARLPPRQIGDQPVPVGAKNARSRALYALLHAFFGHAASLAAASAHVSPSLQLFGAEGRRSCDAARPTPRRRRGAGRRRARPRRPG